MARHNIVTLFAQVLGDPMISKNEETGEFQRGICYVATIRSNRENNLDEDVYRFDKPLIFTGNPDFAEQMSEWKPYDIVNIKGAITTKDINKKTTCKYCGGTNVQMGVLNCISPIYTSVCKTDLSEFESLEELKSYKEVSNQALLIGYVVGDIKYYHPEGSPYRTSLYQVAVNRKYYLKDDVAASRTDYPFVRTFGMQANQDRQCLYQTSMILVDGYVQTKEFDRKKTCEHCDKDYEWTDNSMEVIGYAIEYLQNFKTPEDIEKEKSDDLIEIKKLLGL